MTTQVEWRSSVQRVFSTSPLLISQERRLSIMTMQPNTPSRYVRAIQYDSMTDLLTHFRQTIEHDSNQPIHRLENVNAAMLLSDLCVFLGLSGQNRRKILGMTAAIYLDEVLVLQALTARRH